MEAVDQGIAGQHRMHPVFDGPADHGIGAFAPQARDRRQHAQAVADGAEAHDQEAARRARAARGRRAA